MNKAYFKESFISGLKMMLFILIIGLLIYPLVILTTTYTDQIYLDPYYSYTSRYRSTTDVTIVILYLSALCYFVPILKFNYLQKKRQIDTYYSLPIKRETIVNVNLLVGYLQIIIPYTIVYFLGMGIMALKADFFHYTFYLPLYGTSILMSLGVYLFNSFIFTRGNSLLDGIILMASYSFVGMMIILIVSSTFRLRISSDYGCIPTLFMNATDHFEDLIRFYGEEKQFATSISEITAWDYIFPIILMFIGYAGLFLATKYDKAERAEQITNSYFGYRTIIPFYFCSTIYCITLDGYYTIIFYIIIIVLYIIAEVIHYRKFKLPKKVFIIMIACLVGSILISLVGLEIADYYSKINEINHY